MYTSRIIVAGAHHICQASGTAIDARPGQRVSGDVDNDRTRRRCRTSHVGQTIRDGVGDRVSQILRRHIGLDDDFVGQRIPGDSRIGWLTLLVTSSSTRWINTGMVPMLPGFPGSEPRSKEPYQRSPDSHRRRVPEDAHVKGLIGRYAAGSFYVILPAVRLGHHEP